MHVAVCNHAVFTHSTLALGRFFCKNVTFESFLKSNFTCTGNFKALLGAAVGFNLWHCITYCSYSLLASQTDANFLSPVGNVTKMNFSFRAAKVRKILNKSTIYQKK